MTIHETLLQNVRSWLKFACSLSDEQVLANDYTGPRVALPYMEVRIDGVDEPVGTDEALHSVDEADQLQVRVRGQRRAVMTLRGFGDETMEWMATAAASLFNPITLAYLETLNLSLRAIGPSVKTSPLVDTARESQVNRDFELLYAIETTPQDQIALEHVEVDMTQDGATSELNTLIEEPKQ